MLYLMLKAGFKVKEYCRKIFDLFLLLFWDDLDFIPSMGKTFGPLQ